MTGDAVNRPRWAVGLVVVLLAAVGVAVFVSSAPSTRPSTAAATTPSPMASAPVPSLLVVHAPTATGVPGVIEVVDSGTGRVIRTLGSAYDPYLVNGFQLSADRSTLYYTRLNEPAQMIEIVAAPLAGGPTRVIGHGVDPQLSPDGRLMSFRPYGENHTIAIMTLRTGRVVEARDPAAGTSAAVVSTSWLSGTHRLLVTTATSEGACEAPAGSACHIAQPPPPAAAAYLLDVGTTPTWSRLPALNPLPGDWASLSLQGPGQTPGTVLAVDNGPAAGGGATAQTVVSVEASTGRVLSRVRLPAGAAYLTRDSSGTHFLVSEAAGTDLWSPGHPELRPVGPDAAEAAW